MQASPMTATTIPLFPLSTVLFPEGPLKLRIFEPRYVDMIGRCMREDTGFGVALIIEGREAGGPARTVDTGTLARIVDFEKLSDGLLGITARGEQRFRVLSVHRQSDGLNLAQVEWAAVEEPTALPEEFVLLSELLRRAFPQVSAVYGNVTPRYDDASWVGMRLAELLPLQMQERQDCLEMYDACARLKLLRERIDIREV
jgi:uncharacterized protein